MGTAARGRAFAVGLVTACTIAVAGCSADPDDQPTEATPSSPTPTDDQTKPPGNQVTEPTLPADAEGSSIRSAKAFVGYYIDLLNYASVTGDTKAFDQVAAPACRLCADYSNLFDSIWDDGGFLRSDGMSIERLGVTFTDSRSTALSLVVRAARTRLKESAQEEPSVAPPKRIYFAIEIAQAAASWRVTRFETT